MNTGCKKQSPLQDFCHTAVPGLHDSCRVISFFFKIDIRSQISKGSSMNTLQHNTILIQNFRGALWCFMLCWSWWHSCRKCCCAQSTMLGCPRMRRPSWAIEQLQNLSPSRSRFCPWNSFSETRQEIPAIYLLGWLAVTACSFLGLMILYLLGRRLKQPIFEQLRGGP